MTSKEAQRSELTSLKFCVDESLVQARQLYQASITHVELACINIQQNNKPLEDELTRFMQDFEHYQSLSDTRASSARIRHTLLAFLII